MTIEQCSVCGEALSEVTHVCPRNGVIGDPPLPPTPPERLELVRVAIEWKSETPTAQEILALKELLPELRDESAVHIAERARAASSWPVGELQRFHAERLAERAEGLGVTVRISTL